MWKRLRSGPVIIAAAALGVLWSAPASAGCMMIGGTQYCAAWITGSEDQDATITGLGNIKDTCPDGTPSTQYGCPTIGASVWGTVPPPGAQQSDCVPHTTGTIDPTTGNYVYQADASCGVQGILYCVNPAGNSSHAQGQPYTLNATLFANSTVTANDCAKNGKCSVTTTVDNTFTTDPCVNPNWTPTNFVASEFYGLSQLNWIDNQGVHEWENFVDLCTASLPKNYTPGQMYACTLQYTSPN